MHLGRNDFSRYFLSVMNEVTKILLPGSKSRSKTAQDMSGLSGFSARFERFERFGRFGRFLPCYAFNKFLKLEDTTMKPCLPSPAK